MFLADEFCDAGNFVPFYSSTIVLRGLDAELLYRYVAARDVANFGRAEFLRRQVNILYQPSQQVLVKVG